MGLACLLKKWQNLHEITLEHCELGLLTKCLKLLPAMTLFEKQYLIVCFRFSLEE